MTSSQPPLHTVKPGTLFLTMFILVLACSLASNQVLAQTGSSAASQNPSGSTADKLSADEIATLVGPIALYPDELLAIVLPGSTFPVQIVQASRYLGKRKSDSSLKPDEDWDSSILALLNYPEVIKLMNDDLNWSWKLGEAVVNQQQDVMAGIQTFRAKADEAGNLTSNDKTVVIKETEVIKIESASPEVIYVPSYNPSTVVVYSPAPVPVYYSAPYPYYYSPQAAFWTGMFVGAAISYGLHWHHGHHGHGDININRNTNINRDSRNVNRDTIRQNRDNRQAERGNRGDRSNRGNRQDGGNWRSNRSGGSVGRPGTAPGSVTGRDFANRSGLGSGGTRIGDRGQGSRGTRVGEGGPGSRGTRVGEGSRGSTGSSRSSLGSSRNSGSFGGYQRGSSSRYNSQRGSSSRSSMSRSSRGSFGGGGRSRGGGRRR